MPIHDRNLKAGTKLIGKYHKQPYKCEVIEVEGKLRFRLEDGQEFKSPSAAGMAITGHPCDGWVFWSVQNFGGSFYNGSSANRDTARTTRTDHFGTGGRKRAAEPAT